MFYFRYEIARVALLSKISITHHPELAALAGGDEDLTKFASLPPAVILQRWINHHLSAGPSKKQVANLLTVGMAQILALFYELKLNGC